MIIGLMGYAQSGKDTAYQELIKIKGFEKFKRKAFADMLKLEAISMLSAINVYETTETLNEKKELYRPLLVWLGEFRRRQKPLYWIDKVIDKVIDKEKNIIITDVRYWNEVKAIQEMGGIVIHILRNGTYPANEEEQRSIEEILRNTLEDGYKPAYNFSSKSFLAEQIKHYIEMENKE